MQTYKTKAGTVLPISDIKGKDYLEVKYRLVWFREERPDWSIETEARTITDKSALFRAVVKAPDGRVVATSHKSETIQGFPDFIEKAETGAIGRALALCGYGTQFCGDELDEGYRLADSPANTKTTTKSIYTPEFDASKLNTTTPPTTAQSEPINDPGAYTIGFGKKYKGMKLKELSSKDVFGFIDWAKRDADKNGKQVSRNVQELEQAANAYYTNAFNSSVPKFDTNEEDVPF